jgi:hypothetical protein
MYDFVMLFVRRSVRDSHWSRDYRDGTGIRVFYENLGFYIVNQDQVNKQPETTFKTILRTLCGLHYKDLILLHYNFE